MTSNPWARLSSASVGTFLFAASIALHAQTAPAPPKLEPIPEPPPQAIGFDNDSTSERGVRLSPGAGEQVEEFVIDGRRVIRVTGPGGLEYELVEDLGDGTFARQNPQDSGVRVPRWVIFRF